MATPIPTEESGLPHSVTREPARTPASDVLPLIALLVALLLVAGFALWYTSSGRFPAFPDIQNDYVDLGEAFLSGELALAEEPDPRLAELGNPYEYTQRKGVPYHWDASYYNGKYFLYWGPVPALISAVLQSTTGTSPAASVLVVLPYLGLMGVAAALLWRLAAPFGRFARRTIWLFVIIGFFSFPMLFTIGQPRHYQASIMTGQFFLLLGVLGVAEHVRSRNAAWLGLSGLSWGLALASRYNLAISIAAYILLFSVWLLRDGVRSLCRRLALLAVPFALCLFSLGLYNLARFGDPIETGLTYQLTIPEFRQVSYSMAYVPSGSYSYLLYPLTGAPSFPFIASPHFRSNQLPDALFVPDGREFDQITFGLLPTVPAIWLFVALVPLIIGWIATHKASRTHAVPLSLGGLVVSMLALGAAGQFLFLLVFFYVAERYIVDFYVPLVLCLAVVVWSAHAALRGRSVLQVALWMAAVLLTAWTAGIGYFACFGVPVLVSLYYDPAMLVSLEEVWNARLAALRSVLPGAR
jgi:hypothetical protein